MGSCYVVVRPRLSEQKGPQPLMVKRLFVVYSHVLSPMMDTYLLLLMSCLQGHDDEQTTKISEATLSLSSFATPTRVNRSNPFVGALQSIVKSWVTSSHHGLLHRRCCVSLPVSV